MLEAVQTRRKIHVNVERARLITFSLPEDMLPLDIDSATVFCGDDFDSKFPGAEHEQLRSLCVGLLPIERCKQAEFLFLSRRTKLGDELATTDFKIVCASDQPSLYLRGRIDAALRACGFELEF